jgi:hypothetical protein
VFNKSKLEFIKKSSTLEINSLLEKCMDFDINYKKVEYLNVGSDPTPSSKSSIKKFLQNFGIDEGKVIEILSKAMDIPMFTKNNFNNDGIRVLNEELVYTNNAIYSSNPMWAKKNEKRLASIGVNSIKAITPEQIESLPESKGYALKNKNVFYRKIFQDNILDTYMKNCKYISIYRDKSGYKISKATDYFSYEKEDLLLSKSQLLDFAAYLVSLGGREDEGLKPVSQQKAVIKMELNNQIIKVLLERNAEDEISLELFYIPRDYFIRSYNHSPIDINYSKKSIEIISYENSFIKSFLLKNIAFQTSNEFNALYVYDDKMGDNLFPFNLKVKDGWLDSIQIRQADVLICSFNEIESLKLLDEILLFNKKVVLVTKNINALDAIKKARSLNKVRLDMKLDKCNYFFASPEVCKFCGTKKTLLSPHKYTTFIQKDKYIPDGIEVISRNKIGCERCTFGITEMVMFKETIKPSDDFLRYLEQNKIKEKDLLTKFDFLYDSTEKEVEEAILTGLIDPKDLETI